MIYLRNIHGFKAAIRDAREARRMFGPGLTFRVEAFQGDAFSATAYRDGAYVAGLSTLYLRQAA